MKTLKKIITCFGLATLMLIIYNEKTQAQVSVSFQLFYDELGPYGHWVDYPDYGYVWIPANAGFIPYSTGGHWVFTEFGWTWVSDYSWGWAPFHYGRWYYDDWYGWLWVPGSAWGPAWVVWRGGGGFYGWAPLPPGVSISVAFGPHYSLPYNRWVFVHDRYITSPRLSNYVVNRNENTNIIRNSTIVNNTYVNKSNQTTYVSGPRRDEVQKISGSPIQPVSIKESNKPGQVMKGNELAIYKPAVKNTSIGGTKPAPAKVTDIKTIRPGKNEKQEQTSPAKSPTKTSPASPSSPSKKQPTQDVDHGKINDEQQQQKPGNKTEQQHEIKSRPDIQQNNPGRVRQVMPDREQPKPARENMPPPKIERSKDNKRGK